MDFYTNGKIKGYIKHEDIFDFIKQKWDSQAIDKIRNDGNLCHSIFGFISFKHNGEDKTLFYTSGDYWEETWLAAEQDNAYIIKEIVAQFGGGRVDEFVGLI